MKLVLANDDDRRHGVTRLRIEWIEEHNLASVPTFRFTVVHGGYYAVILIDAREALYAPRGLLELIAGKLIKVGREWRAVCDFMIDRTTYVLPTGSE